MNPSKSLLTKMVIFITAGSVFILGILFAFNYNLSRKIIMGNLQENARQLAFRTSHWIESTVVAIEKHPEIMELLTREGHPPTQELRRILKLMTAQNDEIFGGALAFEPFADQRNRYYSAYYYYEKDGKVENKRLGSDTYNYFTMDWYQIPKILGKPCWSEPYVDVGGGNILMATYSVPFYDHSSAKRRFQGVMTVDVSLEWLQEYMKSIKILETGYAFLLSANGAFITAPDSSSVMNETIFSMAAEWNDPSIRAIGREMTRGAEGFAPFERMKDGEKAWVYYAPVKTTDWSVGVVFPENEFFASIRQLGLLLIALALAGLGLMLVAVTLICRSITRPITSVARAAEKIGAGNFGIELPEVTSGDEVGMLTRSIRRMMDSLKDYIERLRETTAAKERIESELQIAREIQKSMLPRIFPPFPDRKDVDLFAIMEPAQEVGGDFYDFLFIDPHRLFFAIGDVSGKGVPAALFMMITKTLLKNEALQGETVDTILTHTNKIVAMDNDSAMFATVLCGVLDTRNGEVELANAGHNPPVLYKTGQKMEYVSLNKGFVLGPMPGMKYTRQKIQLAPGEGLFLYTDGVTEAMNRQKKCFSEEKLAEVLNRIPEGTPDGWTQSVWEEIAQFADGAPQSDDITILAFKYNG